MDERKYPLNLQGLLRFAMENTKSEDAKGTSAWHEMDEDKRNFLESALKSMTIDVIEEFEKAIGTLENESAPKDQKLGALNLVREYIDNIDFANNFVKVGGTRILHKYLKAEDIQLRVASIYIIAEMSQNNPFCQKHFLDMDVIPLLTSYFNHKDDTIASSSLHAVSSLVRTYEPGIVEFLRIGGIKSIISCLKTRHTRVFVKACFLIACLSAEHAVVRDEFAKKSVIAELSKHTEPVSGFDIKMETLLYAMSEISKSVEWKPDAESMKRVTSLLTNIIEHNKTLPQCEEMVTYANITLNNLKSKEIQSA